MSDPERPESQSSTRLPEAEKLFFEALEVPEEKRADFVRERSRGDDFLRSLVQRLIEADSEGFLSEPAAGRDFSLPKPEELREPVKRRRIGSYELRELLGSGGVGHVWLAGRVDGLFQKEVAIKILKRGMDTDAILRAFENERRVLARLEHPGIARILDGGRTSDGLPYLVMERVDGAPIHRFCEENRIALHERIELFCKVCDAVAYAHRNLVVHRDLKPGNILVRPGGAPTLLDFGIAKVFDPDGPRETTRGNRLMTPEYASPEQLLGEPVTTASDVYSLGVVLYELLTTRKPFEAKTGATTELRRLVCDTEPARPSSRVLSVREREDGFVPEGTPTRLGNALRGDLDTILLTALRKAPEQRYPSVEALSEDLRRFLERRPIMARPPNWRYLSRRFIERNWISVCAGAVACTAVIGALLFSLSAYFAAEEQRQEAVAEAEKASAISAFLERFLITDDPLGKLRHETTVLELLDEARVAVEAGELAEEPEVEAAVLNTLGRTYVHLKAPVPGEACLQRSLALLAELRPPDDVELARTKSYLATALTEQAKLDEGIALQREALEVLRQTLDEPETLINRIGSLSTALRDAARYDEAAELARETIAIAQASFGPRDAVTANEHFRLGWILACRESTAEEGVRELRHALAIQSETIGPDHAGYAETSLRLGQALEKTGSIPKAVASMRFASERLWAIFGESHPRATRAGLNFAELLGRQGRLDEAHAEFTRSIEAKLRALPGAPQGRSRRSHARVQLRRGRLAEAEALFRQAITDFAREEPNFYTEARRTSAERELAALLSDQERFAEAERLLLASIERLEAAPEPHNDLLRAAVKRLIGTYEAWGVARPALELQERARPWVARLEALR